MTDKQLDELLKIFQNRMQKVTDEYLKRMGEQLKDIGELIPSAETRLIQMKRLDMNIKYIQKAIAEAAEKSIEDIATIFEAIAAENVRFAEAYFGERISKEFIMQPLMAQFKATAGEMANLSRTTIESDLYRDAVDKGIQAAQAGVEDYKSAIRRALKEASAEGIRVTYPNGRTKRLDSAARQNVLDGIRKLNQANMELIGKKFGADGIELSAHMMCAEDHLPYQGKQFSNEEFAAIQVKLPRPFGEWNCRHSWSPIILGLSEPAYSDEELQQFKENSTEEITIEGKTKTRYEWTQQQRKIETAIRYQQDIATAAKAAGDDTARREARRSISDLHSYYQKIVDAAEVPARPERMGTYYGKAAGGLKNSQQAVFRTREDPVREVLGSAYDSHPQEVIRIKGNLAKFGVELIEQDEKLNESIGYYPSAVIGKPGQFKINKNASYGAWIHEEQHVIDDKNSGWQGSRVVWTDEASEWERRAYQKEIDLMESLGYNDIAERLKSLLDDEIKRRLG